MHTIALEHPYVIGLKATTDRTASGVERRTLQTKRAQARVAALLLAPTIWDLCFLCRDLDKTIRLFNSPESDQWSESDLKTIVHGLSSITGRITKLLKRYDEFGCANMLVYRSVLPRVAQRNEHLASIVEGLYMSLNHDFEEALQHSAQELRDIVGGTARRSPVAQM